MSSGDENLVTELVFSQLVLLASPNIHNHVKKAIVRYSDNSFISTSLSILLSVLTGSIPVREEERNQLRRNRKQLFLLASTHHSIPEKRRLLVQARFIRLLSLTLSSALPHIEFSRSSVRERQSLLHAWASPNDDEKAGEQSSLADSLHSDWQET